MNIPDVLAHNNPNRCSHRRFDIPQTRCMASDVQQQDRPCPSRVRAWIRQYHRSECPRKNWASADKPWSP